MRIPFVLPLLFAFASLLLLLSVGFSAEAEPLSLTPLPPVTEADGRLGVCYAFYEEPPDSGQRPYLERMIEAGARHDRWDFNWNVIQRDGQSQWNWSGHEKIVRAETGRGVSVTGILLWTPQWASTCPGGTALRKEPLRDIPWRPGLERFPEDGLLLLGPSGLAHRSGPLTPQGFDPWDACPPRNLDQPVFLDNGDPNPDNPWGYFVYHLVRHFSGVDDPALRVDAWEVWNEPEWSFFWTGSAADYYRLLKVAYQAAKAANPNATILFGGLHYWADPDFYKQVLDLAAADPEAAAYNGFFDVMSVHFYSRSDNTYDRVLEIRNEVAARVGDHPIWLTETGAPMWLSGGDPPDYWLTEDEEAAYLIQSYANGLAAGLERYYFFRAHDDGMAEPYGLLRNDQTLRPAYLAYQVAARYLQGENQVTRVATTRTVRVTLWGTPRGKISVLWNRTPNPVTYTLPAAMPQATLVDRWGVTRTITATQGVYTLSLPVATANLASDPTDYIVGGDPLLLIETDTTPPTSTMLALPTLTIGQRVTLTWQMGDVGAGPWYVEVQVASAPDGPWQTAATWPATEGVTQTVYLGRHGQTAYFRARARDRVGNWEDWPATYEVSTTVDADTELHWRVEGLFADADGDGLQGSLEVPLTATMRFVDEQGRDVVSPTVGNSWAFTVTLLPGTYTFSAFATDDAGQRWAAYISLTLDGSVDPLQAPANPRVGLVPWNQVYLPLVRK